MNLGLLPKLNNGRLKGVNKIIMKHELNHLNIKENENAKKHQWGCSKSCFINITGLKEKIYWSEGSQLVPAHPSCKVRPESR
jgi:hypothetical protein